MDALTAFFISAVLILLNGAVLGLMHQDLPKALQPSAFSWRVGTLLQAGGCILLAVQGSLPKGVVLPIAHGMLMLGVTGYWQALRRFYGFSETKWILLPFAAGIAGVLWYSAVQPSQVNRVMAVAAAWSAIVLGCIATLLSKRSVDAASSRRALTGVFVGVVLAIMICWALFGRTTGLRELVGDAGWINLLAPLIAAILPVVGTTAFLQLCSERIRRQWEHAASTDHLTGLPNRRTLANAGEGRVRHARDQGRPLSVAVIDIDNFKVINDHFGHEVGDSALKHAAERIELACRKQDLCGRQGGEEFVVVFNDLESQAALAAAERIRMFIEQQAFVVDGVTVPVTVSIGLADLIATDTSLDDVLRRADRALFRAKKAGRNRVEFALGSLCADGCVEVAERKPSVVPASVLAEPS